MPHVTILAPAKLADFWKSMPEVDAVIGIEKRDGVFGVARKIGGMFDAAIVFPNSVRSGLEVWLAGIPRRVGYKRPWRGPLINGIVPDAPLGPMMHEVNQYLAMARYAGSVTSREIVEPAVNHAPGGLLGIVPGAEYGPAKRWPVENFAEVAEKICAERAGSKWRIFGVAADESAAEVIAGKLNGNCENLAGKTTLAELIERLRECRLVLTNDTGTMHLAAHLGVPVVAVFGSTEDRLTEAAGKAEPRRAASCGVQPVFFAGVPAGFALYVGGNRGRGGGGGAGGVGKIGPIGPMRSVGNLPVALHGTNPDNFALPPSPGRLSALPSSPKKTAADPQASRQWLPHSTSVIS